jgi:hypothetical protein
MKMLKIIIIICLLSNVFGLYPFESESRSKFSLNGLWDFKVDFNNEGFSNNWQTKSFKTEVNIILIIIYIF